MICQGKMKLSQNVRKVSGNFTFQSCKSLDVWSWSIFLAQFMKYFAPISSGKLKFMSGNCQGILFCPFSGNPDYKSVGAFFCHGNQCFDPVFPKTVCSLSPTLVMLHINFYQDWPSGFWDIQVWKCGRRTDDRPLVYYKLTLWAFGSGELINWGQSPWSRVTGTLSSFIHSP